MAFGMPCGTLFRMPFGTPFLMPFEKLFVPFLDAIQDALASGKYWDLDTAEDLVNFTDILVNLLMHSFTDMFVNLLMQPANSFHSQIKTFSHMKIM